MASDLEHRFIEFDARGRVGLGAGFEHRRFLLTVQSDGTMVFTPAVVIPEAERHWLAHPELVIQYNANREDSSRLVRRSAESFDIVRRRRRGDPGRLGRQALFRAGAAKKAPAKKAAVGKTPAKKAAARKRG